MTYDVACPVCGRVNRRLYLEETEGWMECEYCGTSSQDLNFLGAIAKSGNLISCDVFSTYQDGKPIGTQEYLLLDTVSWEFEGVK